ncbi:hypothetical protein P4361_05850 [Fictibacillus sp. B-59209]|uniref:hypothetical protein n=1 Tax=Fictibacillus sp. B-59209 TaxID=3024873 RepID=UPI002E1B201E|nr:hypothetical protein [Fictibacillus sp. B-59209]
MMTKELFLKNFSTEIDKLYKEIDKYHADLVECKLILENKQIELDKINKELKIQKEHNKFLTELINDKGDQINYNITEIYRFFRNGSVIQLEQALRLLAHNPNLNKINEVTISSVLELINEILETGKGFVTDECYFLSLKIINSFYNSNVKSQVEEFFRYKHSSFEGNIYERFSLKLSLELFKSYILFGKKNELVDIYSDSITDFEYFNLDEIDREIFAKLLWYGVFVENEIDFIERFEFISEYLNEHKSEFQLYQLTRNILNNKESFLSNKIRVQNLIKEITVLDPIEKEIIFSFLIDKLSSQTQINQFEINTNLICKTPQYHSVYFLENINLNDGYREKEILLAIYHKPDRNARKEFFKTNVFIKNGDSKAYVNRGQVQKIKKLRMGGWAIIEEYPLSKLINRKQVNIMNSNLKNKNVSASSFKWPTTDVKLDPVVEQNSSNEFLNTTSELAKLGYKITGLNREKRWYILQNAVPKLGLKRVANIIAYNVRLRKKQKNGLIKNSYSIGEWEFDLDRLKKKYYKNDFVWPRLN